ncbi:MAG: UDP-N-acetylglucosamine--N-acetylmuramyl-(pentapeptide) pyrophosphoryl-undecaprenol N-acetylglucosamine transferase [Actinomycetota bacterium]|nr:UDP-N-acetylglucosamine--N-acetylmuramyl-(pentapeptide) pyrophosphoryl-undecaprenol N-acetylglucosamine transferase [Actinomycetota bacterium]
MSARPLSVVLAAGGTAGHIEPALNLADELIALDPNTRICVIGGDRGLESTLVPVRGYQLRSVPSVPMPRQPTLDLLLVWPRQRAAKKLARARLRELQADVVVGFGGYAALPTYLAARELRIPVVIHEANARAGLANRVAARFTPLIYVLVPGSIAGGKLMGLPLRPAIARLDRSAVRPAALANFGLPGDQPVLLVFGGSQGAQRLNAAVAGALPGLLSAGISVLHSYGSKNPAPASQPGYVPLAYIEQMDLAYAAADLAITRAGAMTCAELSAVGLPAIYVPLPIGNGEQRLNALPIVEAGGGLYVADDVCTAEWLNEAVPPLIHDREKLAAMGAAAAGLGDRDAGRQFAEVIARVAITHLGVGR